MAPTPPDPGPNPDAGNTESSLDASARNMEGSQALTPSSTQPSALTNPEAVLETAPSASLNIAADHAGVGRESRQALDNSFAHTFTLPHNLDTPLGSASELFADRIRQYLRDRVQSPPNRSGNNQEAEADPSHVLGDSQPSLPASLTGMNLFDEILDTVLGHRPTESQTRNPGASEGTEDANAPNSSPQATEPLGTNASTDVSNVDGATVFTTGVPGGQPGAIVITVNYMFMDSGQEQTPGRTGLLVVTIPNNATNREPHIISLFISLATRMAYSALINNGPKPKPGITLEKFQSFKTLNVDDLNDKSCAICFEQYESAATANVEDLITTKKRKLSPSTHVSSASVTPELHSSLSAQIERENPPSAEAASNSNQQDERPSENTNEEAEQKVYLCDHEQEFDHAPLQMPCKHVFGRSCLAHWLKENTNCPLCRLSVADPDQTPARSSGIPPISYIRFGGLDDLTGGLFNSLSEDSQQSEGSAAGETESSRQTSSGANSNESTAQNEQEQHAQLPDAGSLPGLLRRATLVIFNQPGRRNTETPPAPLDAMPGPGHVRERNPPFTPVINNIQNYFRRRRREADRTGSHSLFASGVASRRTPHGVETVTSESDPLQGQFRSSDMFSDDFGRRASRERNPRSASTTVPSLRSLTRGPQEENPDGPNDQSEFSGNGDNA